MIKNKFYLLSLSLLLLYSPLKGEHLVGGELVYECLGNNNYKITLIMYRDCFSNGAAFDQKVTITIYDAFNVIVADLFVPILSQVYMPIINPNSCVILPQTVCVEKAIYEHTVQLDPILGGYTITHQRCCRNTTIANVSNNPSQWGSTYTTSIPSNDFSCNSSPKFKNEPPIVLCLRKDVQLDLSAKEPDGDSLSYEFCHPLHGGGRGRVAPSPASPPPYQKVPFLSSFSSSFPISSFPPFQIDPQTGILTGTPTQVGQFLFAICVKEYRNGVLISRIRRDYQFNISGDCETTTAIIIDQSTDPSTLCGGKTIGFDQRSLFASTYYWDFGDSSITADTSRLPSPTYTYRDTGTYNVMLVADPYTTCADTSYSLFRVHDSLRINFSYKGLDCFEDHSLDFTTNGVWGTSAEITWNFGGPTRSGNILTGVENPKNVKFLFPDNYIVTVTVRDNHGCADSSREHIRLITKSVLKHHVPITRGCPPVVINFTDSSESEVQLYHFWNFGDGGFSEEQNPIHSYSEPGLYSVTHSVISKEDCIDTVTGTFPEVIEVFPQPFSAINVIPEVSEFPESHFTINNASQEYTTSKTYLPFGSPIENLTSLDFNIGDTGSYKIIHIVYNQFNCKDATIKEIRVEIPAKIFIPNAFTPNNDGINDVLGFSVSGIRNFKLAIFDRWGNAVFKTTSTDNLWNGKDLNTGKLLNTAVYTYIVNATVKRTNEIISQRGFITLIR